MAKSKSKLIINIICYIIIAVLLLSTVMLFVGRATNKVTFFFGRAAVLILSPSMSGTFEEGTYIEVERIDSKDIKVGDVIMFYSDDPDIKDSLNTHRVVEIIGDNSEFVTKGDNNLSNDEYTAKADRVVGLYIKNLPMMTSLFKFFLSKIGFAVIILGIFLATVAICLPDIIKYFRKRKAENDEAYKRKLIDEEIERLKKQNNNK